MEWVRTKTSAGRIAIDPAIGNIRQLEFDHGDRTISPLHTAPWVDDEDPLEGENTPPVEVNLAGDFFCAPFGADNLDGSPAHGWTANSRWDLMEQSPGTLRFQLERTVMGARFTKTLTLSEDAPLLLQTHDIEGGEGGLPVAHHPMIRLSGRGTLSTSPKRAAISPKTPLEPGRHRLASGQRVEDISRFPSADGITVDLQDLPIGDRHEDFLTLIEAEGADIGWTAVVREEEDDIIFILKDPDVLPVTMLWHSNGGRDYAPWNGRHNGVLGIEDGCSAGADGHQGALVPNPISNEGVKTALTLGPSIRIAHVIGAIPRPAGWIKIADIIASDNQITLTDSNGETVAMPFDTAFLKKEP